MLALKFFLAPILILAANRADHRRPAEKVGFV
jgi:hypothetical protein